MTLCSLAYTTEMLAYPNLEIHRRSLVFFFFFFFFVISIFLSLAYFKMSLIGNIGPYEESENISTYIDRVKLYFKANGISQEKQVPAFFVNYGS